jgi:hypothetical protein
MAQHDAQSHLCLLSVAGTQGRHRRCVSQEHRKNELQTNADDNKNFQMMSPG